MAGHDEITIDRPDVVTSDMAVEQSRAGFNILDQIVKNPQGQISPEDVESNLGTKDSRVLITESMEIFESVLSLNENCTATIVQIEGYAVENGGTIAVTAAHCVDEYAGDELTLYGSFVNDDGAVERFTRQYSQVWVHPFPGDFNLAFDPGTVNSSADVAFIYFDEQTPPLVTPAEFVPIDVDGVVIDLAQAIETEAELGNLTVEELINKYEQGFIRDYEDLVVPSEGFSGDQVGLTADPRAMILGMNGSQTITTDADYAQGASGGPNYLGVTADDGVVEIQRNAEGQPRIFAVNSAGQGASSENPNPDEAYVTALKPEFLNTVPFLNPVYDDGAVCETQTGIINNPNGANIRYGDGEIFQTLIPDRNGPSALPWGVEVDIHSVTENYLGEQWALVTGPNGRTGYVNSDLINANEQRCSIPLNAPSP